MEKEKLGSFISELRKEHSMTQKELSERLGVTDKAVSKWERGLSFPDISLLEPLANTFEVSVMELLQGKRLPKEEAIPAVPANEVLDDLLRISDDEIRKKHVISKSIIILCCVSLLLLVSIILNIINLSNASQSQTLSPDLGKEAYETIRNENDEPIFRNPEKAVEQMAGDALNSSSEEWTYLMEILKNTYKEVSPE